MKNGKLFTYLAFGNLLVLIAKATTESSSKEISSKKNIDYDFAESSTEIPSTTDELIKVSEDISHEEINSDFVNQSTETPSSPDDATQVSQDQFDKQTYQDFVNYSTTTDIPNNSTGLEDGEDIDYNFETHDEYADTRTEISYDAYDTRTEISYAAEDFTEIFEDSPSTSAKDDSGFSKTEATDVADHAEIKDHNILTYSAYVIGWFFFVLLIFIGAVCLLCLLTAMAGVFYWIYIGCRKIVRKCCFSKEVHLSRHTHHELKCAVNVTQYTNTIE